MEAILDSDAFTAPAARRPLPAPPLKSRTIQRRDLHIAILLFVVVILNAADLACSLFAQRLGLLQERNPLADSFLRVGLLHSFIAFKILMVFSGSFMLWRLRESHWSIPACWILIAAYSALGVLWYLWMRDINFAYEVQLTLGPVHELSP